MRLYTPDPNSKGEDNGQVTIVGGSHLFHGAPLLALRVASRIVDMVFFSSPEPTVGRVAENLKSKLFSFIWVPWDEVEHYIEKSDAVLVGPGFLRFSKETMPRAERYNICDEACQVTKKVTENLLRKFPDKRWVIDAGSLQTIDPSTIPPGAVLTPNRKEFNLLFAGLTPQEAAEKHNCIMVLKGPETIVAAPGEYEVVRGGNPGLTKGGTGDVQAGLTVALLAKSDPFLAAVTAARVVKLSADELYRKQGVYYNADDLAEKIPSVLFSAETALK